MNNEIEYYLGYLRNPSQVITSGFQDVQELEVVVECEDNTFREVTTRGKIFLEKPNEVFYGHRVFQSNSIFIGRVAKKLTKEEAYEKLEQLKSMKEEYANKLIKLRNDTQDLAIMDEKNYIDATERFVKAFRK